MITMQYRKWLTWMRYKLDIDPSHDESVACPLSEMEVKVCELFHYMASCRAIIPVYDPAFPCSAHGILNA
jgi:hypothetical protein